jgi:hypothetical protein
MIECVEYWESTIEEGWHKREAGKNQGGSTTAPNKATHAQNNETRSKNQTSARFLFGAFAGSGREKR